MGLAVVTLPPEAAAPKGTAEPAPALEAEETDAPAEELTETPPAVQEEQTPPAEAPDEDAPYSSPEDVAAYLHRYGRLPSNYITKAEAQALGWDSRSGNLWEAAPGKSIGGDRFGNYEGLLPPGSYRECDVNYTGGFRGAERLIYGSDGSIWYTADHYNSFTRLY